MKVRVVRASGYAEGAVESYLNSKRIPWTKEADTFDSYLIDATPDQLKLMRDQSPACPHALHELPEEVAAAPAGRTDTDRLNWWQTTHGDAQGINVREELDKFMDDPEYNEGPWKRSNSAAAAASGEAD